MPSRELKHAHNCECCGDWFESNRYDAQFCSSKCRKRANRESKAANIAAERILELIEEYRDKFILKEVGAIRESNALKLSQVAKTSSAIVRCWSE